MRTTQAPNPGPTKDCERNPFYVLPSTVAQNNQFRSAKKRRTDGPLNVTFAPLPPSSPRRVRFAEVTQITRDITKVRCGLTNYTCAPANRRLYEYASKPPSVQGLVSTTDDHGIPDKVYQEVHYSREADAPDSAKEYAGVLFRIRGGTGLSALDEWDGEDNNSVPGLYKRKKGPFRLPKVIGTKGWEYSQCPPSRKKIRSWLLEDPMQTKAAERKGTRASQVGFWMSTGCSVVYHFLDRGTYSSVV